jgi:hypothetical protein
MQISKKPEEDLTSGDLMLKCISVALRSKGDKTRISRAYTKKYRHGEIYGTARDVGRSKGMYNCRCTVEHGVEISTGYGYTIPHINRIKN